jgi:hypothetical protein
VTKTVSPANFVAKVHNLKETYPQTEAETSIPSNGSSPLPCKKCCIAQLRNSASWHMNGLPQAIRVIRVIRVIRAAPSLQERQLPLKSWRFEACQVIKSQQFCKRFSVGSTAADGGQGSTLGMCGLTSKIFHAFLVMTCSDST